MNKMNQHTYDRAVMTLYNAEIERLVGVIAAARQQLEADGLHDGSDPECCGCAALLTLRRADEQPWAPPENREDN